MIITVLFGIFLFSVNTKGQMNNQYDPNYQELEDNLYQDQEDSELYPDNEYDDSAWSQLQYKIQRLMNLDEYSNEEEKYYAARGVPIATSQKHHCVEKLDGPHNTTNFVNNDEVYPSKYYNVTCTSADGHETNHKQMNVVCKSHKQRYGCQASQKPIKVFRAFTKHGKKCWRLEKTIHIQTGCSCYSFFN